jgi:NAD(P)-dependent dehydrogenase (short-subunit alcohol dehydrogenase family)
VAVVTGAGSGIGRAVAVELAAAGAQVWATSRNEDTARETAALVADGQSCEPLGMDVTSEPQRRRLADRLTAGPGRVDVLVMNAGIDLDHEPALEALTDDEWDRVIETNLSSVFRLVRDLLPMMGAGTSLVTIGSANSLIARPYAAAYVASKAVELAPRGIRANCVCPGNIDTPLTDRFLDAADDRAAALASYAEEAPLRRLGTAGEVAGCVRFLASDAASFVTGSALVVDGGMTSV